MAIIVSIFEFIFALMSAMQYQFRRSKLILFMTFVNVLFVGFGLLAKLSLSFCGLIAHSTYMISVIGGFYIYIMIDYLIRRNQDLKGRGYNNDGNLNETTVMFLTSLPLLFLFIMGVYSLVLLLKVDDEIEARREQAAERIRQM